MPRLRRACARGMAARRLVSGLLVAASSLEARVSPADGAFSPVIGVLAEPLGEDTPGSYLEAWYVKWVEAQGARVVPLRYDAPAAEVEALLARVNGLLFPGGGVAISEEAPYGSFSSNIFTRALQERMPVWGTCLGFEQLMLYSSGEPAPGPLTSGWASEKIMLPLNLTQQGKVSPLLADWPEDLKRATARENVTWHFHEAGVSTSDFEKSETLSKFWHVLATNVDLRGQEFVSVVEGKDGLPFFGTQFHPEKNANEFEESSEASLPGGDSVHSAAAVEMAARMAQHFVGRARGFLKFGFTREEFWKWSIANWPMQLAGQLKQFAALPPHMQVYYFPPVTVADKVPSESKLLV
mmetsp:Transcript_58173/g.188269  ORF Transcript_58173/g.188269 Transcript_58173/m.188269 type:complete len:353 (-) Transcript_58173:225-1283(-)